MTRAHTAEPKNTTQGSHQPLDVAAAWAVLEGVLDPEVPVLSVVELGIVRDVEIGAEGELTVVITPTYSGCPATEAIAAAITDALSEAGASSVKLSWRLTPAWSSDWLHPGAAEKLRQHGIAPPGHLVGEPSDTSTQTMFFRPQGIECPRCRSADVEQLSAFGGTACKALYRCVSCREPFEYFKPI